MGSALWTSQRCGASTGFPDASRFHSSESLTCRCSSMTTDDPSTSRHPFSRASQFCHKGTASILRHRERLSRQNPPAAQYKFENHAWRRSSSQDIALLNAALLHGPNQEIDVKSKQSQPAQHQSNSYALCEKEHGFHSRSTSSLHYEGFKGEIEQEPLDSCLLSAKSSNFFNAASSDPSEYNRRIGEHIHASPPSASQILLRFFPTHPLSSRAVAFSPSTAHLASLRGHPVVVQFATCSDLLMHYATSSGVDNEQQKQHHLVFQDTPWPGGSALDGPTTSQTTCNSCYSTMSRAAYTANQGTVVDASHATRQDEDVAHPTPVYERYSLCVSKTRNGGPLESPKVTKNDTPEVNCVKAESPSTVPLTSHKDFKSIASATVPPVSTTLYPSSLVDTRLSTSPMASFPASDDVGQKACSCSFGLVEPRAPATHYRTWSTGASLSSDSKHQLQVTFEFSAGLCVLRKRFWSRPHRIPFNKTSDSGDSAASSDTQSSSNQEPPTAATPLSHSCSSNSFSLPGEAGVWEALVIRRNEDTFFEVPKGHLEKDETLQAGAERELREETGLLNHVVVKKPVLSEIYTIGTAECQRTEKTVHYFEAELGELSPLAYKDFVDALPTADSNCERSTTRGLWTTDGELLDAQLHTTKGFKMQGACERGHSTGGPSYHPELKNGDSVTSHVFTGKSMSLENDTQQSNCVLEPCCEPSNVKGGRTYTRNASDFLKYSFAAWFGEHEEATQQICWVTLKEAQSLYWKSNTVRNVVLLSLKAREEQKLDSML